MPRTLGHPFVGTNRANAAPSLYVFDMYPAARPCFNVMRTRLGAGQTLRALDPRDS